MSHIPDYFLIVFSVMLQIADLRVIALFICVSFPCFFKDECNDSIFIPIRDLI